jgi:hypothetical protein
MNIIFFLGSLLLFKSLVIGSDFSFYYLMKYGKVYWDWYCTRPKFQPPTLSTTIKEATAAINQLAAKKQTTIDLSKSQMMCGNCLAFEDEGHKPWCSGHKFKQCPPLVSQSKSIIQG